MARTQINPQAMEQHGVDALWGDFGCGHDQVALVFPAFIICHNDDLARCDIRNGLFHFVERIVHAGFIRKAAVLSKQKLLGDPCSLPKMHTAKVGNRRRRPLIYTAVPSI